MIAYEVGCSSKIDLPSCPGVVITQCSGKCAHTELLVGREVKETILTVHIVKRSKGGHLKKKGYFFRCYKFTFLNLKNMLFRIQR